MSSSYAQYVIDSNSNVTYLWASQSDRFDLKAGSFDCLQEDTLCLLSYWVLLIVVQELCSPFSLPNLIEAIQKVCLWRREDWFGCNYIFTTQWSGPIGYHMDYRDVWYFVRDGL